MDTQTLENNKLIAEFMTDEPEVLARDLEKAGTLEAMHYHDDWEWIMLVVDKIEDMQDGEEGDTIRAHLFDVEIRQSVCLIVGAKIEMEGGTKKQAVYWAIVEFIKWYNENKEA